MKYDGNGIYDYIRNSGLNNYFFLAKTQWIMLYGNNQAIPKLLAFISEVNNITLSMTENEKHSKNVCEAIAEQLKLPFITVRFSNSDHNNVELYMSEGKQTKIISYERLRDAFEYYSVIPNGTPKKEVNQYTSSAYHNWQRANLGNIVVTDLDLIRFENKLINCIIELKRSKKSLDSWRPYPDDFSNFALISNAITLSGKDIPFYLYYNLLSEGRMGERSEDLSRIKVFRFNTYDGIISSREVQYSLLRFSTLPNLIL